jgi:hypothetical protein
MDHECRATKLGIRAITTYVPKWVFYNALPYEIVINFEELHVMYHRQLLGVKLISVWCL